MNERETIWLTRCRDIAAHLSQIDVDEWALDLPRGNPRLSTETGLELLFRERARRVFVSGLYGAMDVCADQTHQAQPVRHH